ncbi:ATP-binding protein [Streptococcus sp. H31]|uniref:ATP-binding protein n=1 Tax=Streptococcus huangxiaojuni TaxID=3237239 RepID=UPI0034A10B2A
MSKTVKKQRYVSPDRVDINRSNTDSLFELIEPKRKLDNLILSDSTREQINSLITKVKHYDILYNTFGLKEIDPSGGRTAINLYGPPGTGKSITAEAIANELGKTVIRANYAEIESKFVGETPKNIKILFSEAAKTDSILIFDEADSLLSKRLSSVNQSTDHAVNVTKSVLLLELDVFSGIVIFTTNFGQNYDPAFVRRIIGHIKLELPNKELRYRLFEQLIPDALPILITEQDKETIIEQTEGFSGGDLLNVVLYASSNAVSRDGKDCNVLVSDFISAVNILKQAKKEVGTKL